MQTQTQSKKKSKKRLGIPTQEDMAILLREGVDWDAFYRMAESLINDAGFKSNADNFARAVMYEKALEMYSTHEFEVIHIDEDGCDTIVIIRDANGHQIYRPIRMELKTISECLFYVQKCKNGLPGDFKKNKIKMKNFRGDTSNQTVDRYKSQKDFDFLLILQTNSRSGVVAKNSKKLRSNYVPDGDGVFVNLPDKGLYDKINMPDQKVSIKEVLKKPRVRKYSTIREENDRTYLKQFVS